MPKGKLRLRHSGQNVRLYETIGATRRASTKVGIPIWRTFPAYLIAAGLRVSSWRFDIQNNTKLTNSKTAKVSTAFHLQAPASPNKMPERYKSTLRYPIEMFNCSAAVYATNPHSRKKTRNTSIIATRDITNRKLLNAVNP